MSETRKGKVWSKIKMIGEGVQRIMQHRLFLYLRIAVTVGLVALILKLIDFGKVMSTLAQAQLLAVLVIFPLVLFDRYLMAVKWADLLRARGSHMTDGEAFNIYMASTFVGTILPTGVGSDVFRAVRTSVGGRKADKVTASIVIERAIGMVAVTLLAIAGLAPLAAQGPGEFRTLLIATVGLLAVLIAAIYVSVDLRTFALTARLLSRFERYKPVRMFMDLHNAYMELGNQRSVLVGFLLLSILEQFVAILFNYIASVALHLNVPFVYFVALVPLSRYITLLPISVGGIGVTEGTYVVLFALAGLASAQSLSLALLLRVIGWLLLIPAGVLFLLDSIRFKRAQAQDRAQEVVRDVVQ